MPSSQYCLARALYDNIADAPDELPFRKGDTLVVLEQNTANIEGWWLCSLRGRQGICPANRLRLIPGIYNDCHHQQQSHPNNNDLTRTDANLLKRQTKGANRHLHSNQVVSPRKVDEVSVYDTPPNPVSVLTPANDSYDVPPSAISIHRHPSPTIVNSPLPPVPSVQQPTDHHDYDIPRPLHGQLTPSSSISSLTVDSSLDSSNRSSVATMPDYDVPRPHQIGGSTGHLTYDIPRPPSKELPLDLQSALDTLDRLQNDTLSAIQKLLTLLAAGGATQRNLMETKLALARLRSALYDLVEFGEGALANASNNKANDKTLSTKLAPIVLALKRVHHVIVQGEERTTDVIDQLVTCARTLTDDVRQMVTFIHANGKLLFKCKDPPMTDCQTDYEYIRSISETKSEHRNSSQNNQQTESDYDQVRQRARSETNGDEMDRPEMNADDKQILTFFATQFVAHHKNLTASIDAFLHTLEHNQPPKVFLAHGKFVVINAHKLVHIADSVHRCIDCKDVKERTLTNANNLSDALTTCVNKTKLAAMHFPSVAAVQEMVDSIVDVTYLARELKMCLVQAATCHP